MHIIRSRNKGLINDFWKRAMVAKYNTDPETDNNFQYSRKIIVLPRLWKSHFLIFYCEFGTTIYGFTFILLWSLRREKVHQGSCEFSYRIDFELDRNCWQEGGNLTIFGFFGESSLWTFHLKMFLKSGQQCRCRCSSSIGEQCGAQETRLQPGCLEHHGPVQHETMHVFGDEMTRYDEALHISINWDNIKESKWTWAARVRANPLD